ncbi:hypothetical protein [Burkholderia territorii]|uniref:hypothetical protein n=1 Tax=Burkholderia territorii TaxID=1503055 RepID=UPI0039BF3A93
MSPQEAARFCFVRGAVRATVFLRAGAGWLPELAAVFARFVAVARRAEVTGAATASITSATTFLADERRRAGVEAGPASALAAGFPPVARALRFGDAFVAGLSHFAGVPREAVFFPSVSSAVLARFRATGAAFADAGAGAGAPRRVFAVPGFFPVVSLFAALSRAGSVSAGRFALSARGACAFFLRRVPSCGPAASTFPSVDIPAGNTDSSVRIPAASSRFCAAVSRFTQYSARDAIDRSGSGNDASTARGLRERV